MSGTAGRFALLVSKFRGCLVGSLVGDCLGALPEVEQALTAAVASSGAKRHVFGLTSQDSDEGAATSPYSAHTRMLRCVADSLLNCRGFNRDDINQRLMHENNVNKAFPGLRSSVSSGMISSPKYQADAVAVRSIPFAMFFYGDAIKAADSAKEGSSVWLRAPDGGIGAVLQCMATHLSLQFDPIRPLNVDLFLDHLMSVMAEVEASAERTNRQGTVIVNQDKPSLRKLEAIRELLRCQYDTQKSLAKLDERCADTDSVAAAIFTFLKSEQQRDGKSKKNPIEHLLQETVSVSRTGDTLTSLSCSLAGAFHGIEAVPVNMRKRCQGLYDTVKLADKLALPFETQPGILTRKEISFVQRV